MNHTPEISENENVPVFAATTGVTGYKFGTEAYLDLLFMRPIFTIDKSAEQSINAGGTMSAQAKMKLKNVSSVTLTEAQARQLITAIEDQLEKLKDI
ncbi:MAG: hypothetical protein QM578_09280 [Pantoea sp.]|uniref:hypothetical protein n=1 Tax=Pantoea sp. TaxID=69393 RepID=UPI0039E2B891